MKVSSVLRVSSLVALATAQEDPTSQVNATVCVEGAHVIVARASGEQPGYGILNPVKNMILERIPNSNSIAVPYPATIAGPVTYFVSEPEGVGNMTQLIKEYYDACPGRKMVLLGYSQGAHVIGDTLLGSDYLRFAVFPNTTTIGQQYIDAIAAVVMMGDPANVAGEPFLRGNSTNNGTFPRNNTADWVNYGLVDKTVSYCDANDTYCDQGTSLAVHVSYIGEYGTQAADFVVEKFNAAGNSSSNATTTGGASTSTSGSPSSTSSGAASSTSSSSAMTLTPGLSTYTVVGTLQCLAALVLTFAM